MSINDVVSVLVGLMGKIFGFYLLIDNLMVSVMKMIGQKIKVVKLLVVMGLIEMVEDGGIVMYGFNYYELGEQIGKMVY